MRNDIFIRTLRSKSLFRYLTHNNIIIINNFRWPQIIYEWDQLIESTNYQRITLGIYDIKYN